MSHMHQGEPAPITFMDGELCRFFVRGKAERMGKSYDPDGHYDETLWKLPDDTPCFADLSRRKCRTPTPQLFRRRASQAHRGMRPLVLVAHAHGGAGAVEGIPSGAGRRRRHARGVVFRTGVVPLRPAQVPPVVPPVASATRRVPEGPRDDADQRPDQLRLRPGSLWHSAGRPVGQRIERRAAPLVERDRVAYHFLRPRHEGLGGSTIPPKVCEKRIVAMP